ncbi:amino acid ABC transporter permease [Caballeronia sp. dw_276]|jgi:polar amino acid transport system permease protein|uniref:amino acid ABC transporter permease n=1 Tax=Caballeronia sp. dw_276 TaxID=2719795 RepID=UPI001BD427EE|nr:amino acid ABC transporter permease [Caballeronia sp. dw_276]
MSIDLAIVQSSILPLLKGLKVTAQVCVLGIPLGIVAGTVAAYFRASTWRVLRAVALSYVEFVRNVPFLILVYLSFFGLPKLGVSMPAFAIGVAATAFYTGGYFSEILRAAFGSLAHGQVQAARSLGLSGLQVQRHVVLPQIFGFLAPATTSLTIMMFKDSSIFSVMSLTELTYQSNLLTADTFAYVEVLGTTALIYWLCSVLLDVAGQWSERYATRYRRV